MPRSSGSFLTSSDTTRVRRPGTIWRWARGIMKAFNQARRRFQTVLSHILINMTCLPRAVIGTSLSTHSPARLSRRVAPQLRRKAGISDQRAPPNILALRHEHSMRSLCLAAMNVVAPTTVQVPGFILARAISPTRASSRKQVPPAISKPASFSPPRT